MTVANAITSVLPDEQIIYFGDTAHLPYGDKSPASIKHYAVKITDFLLQKKCKIILIACNTASSVAYKTVQKHVGNKAIVINVIDPIVEFVAKNFTSELTLPACLSGRPAGRQSRTSRRAKVGVIGTKGTINSRIYAKKINKLNPEIKVVSLATPLLAPMIEEGFFNNNISRTIINSYLSKNAFIDINALILACTHYPLIKKEIEEYYNNQVNIIDSSEVVAQYVYDLLKDQELLNNGAGGKHCFYVSDYTDSFEKSTRVFFKNEIHLNAVSLWK